MCIAAAPTGTSSTPIIRAGAAVSVRLFLRTAALLTWLLILPVRWRPELSQTTWLIVCLTWESVISGFVAQGPMLCPRWVMPQV